MITAGRVRARAKELQYVKSPAKGTPGIRVTFELLEGPDKGAQIDWTGWLTDNTTARTAEALSNMGYDGTNPETAFTKDVSVTIQHREYTKTDGGQGFAAEVAWVNPLSVSKLETMSSAETGDASARLRAAMGALGKKTSGGNEPKF